MADSNKNLVSLADRPEEERREIARSGGIASGKARRERRSIQEAFEIIMDSPSRDADAAEELERVGLPATIGNQIVLNATKKACSNVAMLKFLVTICREEERLQQDREKITQTDEDNTPTKIQICFTDLEDEKEIDLLKHGRISPDKLTDSEKTELRRLIDKMETDENEL